MKVIKTYGSFNANRYGNPWVAMVNHKTAKIDFGRKVGGYTGAYNKGDAGELYITDPVEGDIYAYGQKDCRGKNSKFFYVKYVFGDIVPIEKKNLIEALNN